MASEIRNNNSVTDDTPASSGYVGTLHSMGKADFSEYLGDRYTNISPMYESPSGPMVLYTAVRYGKRYILKGLKDPYRKDPVYNLVLRKEFEIGISIDHPNVRRTLGFEEIPELGWVIVLEYIDGTTLDRAIEDGLIDASNARRLASQLAESLHYLHSRQIIHRDIKPGNILITYANNDVKVIDLSLADSESYLILKNPAGTKNYMAPELFEPHGKPSVASDIYSFGLIVKLLASLGKDTRLYKVADRCTVANPTGRPQSIDALNLPTEPLNAEITSIFSIDSPRLTRILIILAFLMSILTLFLARQRGML